MQPSIAVCKTFLALLFLTCLFGCVNGPNYKAVSLPSGKQIKVIAVQKMYFSKGAPALVLKYQTDLDVNDKAALRSEADEIWPTFQKNVEHENLNSALIIANAVPQGTLIKTVHSYNFVYEKTTDGTWRCLNGSAN
jgi:hypothetical protein